MLESEVRRLKVQLAAHAGREDLILFFVDGNIEDAAYMESLKGRLRSVLYFAWCLAI